MDSFELHNVLFVYDSLMRGMERENFLSKEKTKFLCSATTPGALYSIGDFPALVLDSSSNPQETPALTNTTPISESLHGDERRVCGELFEIFDPRTFFETLDIIEGYWPEQAERSLFLRRLISVETANGETKAWAYLLNLPLNGWPAF